MMFVVIGAVAAIAALLTLFSGFGLGTLLLPAFALFFEMEIAVALTGVVHLANNLFKLALLGKAADLKIVARFGIPSVLGALLGAWALGHLVGLGTIDYLLVGETLHTSPLKIVMALLMLFFVLMELVPKLKNASFPTAWLLPGGLLSGFFGGLSGHQGALRSAFLIRLNLSKTSFIATGVTIACLVDVTRLPVYFNGAARGDLLAEWPLLLTASLCAFTGVYFGTKLLKKVTVAEVQWAVSAMLLVIAILLGMGLV